jgi:succinate dehydrogenase/fumarate reductase flavoprotein subunit
VILATGDNGSNQEILDYYCSELRTNNIKEFWPNMDVEGKPTNTGDGLKLGAWVNAAIQEHHAPMTHWPCFITEPVFRDQTVFGSAPLLLLNKDGKRFTNENLPGQQLENQVELQPDRSVFQFFDAGWPEQVPFFPAEHGGKCYVVEQQAKNNTASVGIGQTDIDAAVEAGWCYKADTLEGLLDTLGDIDKQQALASIKRYNQLAKDGKDEDFDKPVLRMFALENPPYYACKATVATMLVCIGGLESDEDCHVLSNDRKVIPGLYAAGNIQGNRFAVWYPIALAGVSHSLALYYGYVAGKNATEGI